MLNLVGIYKLAGRRYDVPWQILDAQDWVESRGQVRQVHVDSNGSVDRGIAQINSKAHPHVSAAQAFDPRFAIAWQARYLASLWARYRNWPDVLSAYNSGRPLPRVPGWLRGREEGYANEIIRLANAMGADIKEGSSR